MIESVFVPDEVRDAEGVEEVSLYLSPGDRIEMPHSSNDRVGHIICSGPDAEAAVSLADWALGEIEVVLS